MRALVVCNRRYNGQELWAGLGAMVDRGVEFELASTTLTIEDETTHRPSTIGLTIEDIDPDRYDGLMVVSGVLADTQAYWYDKRVQDIVVAINEADKPLCAICCAVPTIRYAAAGKRVSFYPLIRSRLLLQDAGAIITNASISADANLVTGEHQFAATTWAEAFVNLMFGEPHGVNLVPTTFKPLGGERKPIPALDPFRKKES